LKTLTKKLYEALFLVDSSLAAADWDAVNKAIETILKKAKAEVVSMRKWDERKLAYEVDHKGRGTYILCYFRVDGQKIQQIERQVRLSEQITRVLILCAEHQTQEDIEKDTPATEVEKQKQKTAQKETPQEKSKEPEPPASVQADTEEPEQPAAAQAEAEEIKEPPQSLIDSEPEKTEPEEPSASVQVDTEESEQPAAAQAEAEEIEEPPQSLMDSEPKEAEPQEQSSPPQADAEEQEKEKEPEID